MDPIPQYSNVVMVQLIRVALILVCSRAGHPRLDEGSYHLVLIMADIIQEMMDVLGDPHSVPKALS